MPVRGSAVDSTGQERECVPQRSSWGHVGCSVGAGWKAGGWSERGRRIPRQGGGLSREQGTQGRRRWTETPRQTLWDRGLLQVPGAAGRGTSPRLGLHDRQRRPPAPHSKLCRDEEGHLALTAHSQAPGPCSPLGSHRVRGDGRLAPSQGASRAGHGGGLTKRTHSSTKADVVVETYGGFGRCCQDMPKDSVRSLLKRGRDGERSATSSHVHRYANSSCSKRPMPCLHRTEPAPRPDTARTTVMRARSERAFCACFPLPRSDVTSPHFPALTSREQAYGGRRPSSRKLCTHANHLRLRFSGSFFWMLLTDGSSARHSRPSTGHVRTFP